MVINIDVFILENFIVDFFLMYITFQAVKIKVKLRKIILPSVIGALYSLTPFLPNNAIFISLPFKLSIVLLFMFLPLGRKSVSLIFKCSFIYILFSMILSGICYFLGVRGFYMDGALDIENFNYKYLLLAMMIVYVLLTRLIDFIKDRNIMNNFIYYIEIVNGNKVTRVKAFLDTGNELREPATNLPVIIVEKQYIRDINLKDDELFYIPYKVVNGEKGNLVGFKPTGVKIYYDSNNIKFKDAIICSCEEKLSSTNEYEALLSRGIM